MEFNEKLQLLRRTRGISQEKLAEEIGVSRQVVSKWEEGDEIPDMYDLMALSDWFNVSLDELLRDRINPRTLQLLSFLEEEVEENDNDLIPNTILTIAMIMMIMGFIFNHLLIGIACGAVGVGVYYLMRLKKRQ
ncbi:MAG: helix-turn-helix transcriptional regulator [Turicibacter sp.]|nr:helix-turn-helix transcriptional regulator [Turicibacter sp.]